MPEVRMRAVLSLCSFAATVASANAVGPTHLTATTVASTATTVSQPPFAAANDPAIAIAFASSLPTSKAAPDTAVAVPAAKPLHRGLG